LENVVFQTNRRHFLKNAAAIGAGVGLGWGVPAVDRMNSSAGSLFAASHVGIPLGERATQHKSVEVLNPCNRVPLSFIVDDSTCLVNMGHFCMPQFAAAWRDRDEYDRPWQSWPREIPDSFVREFGEWCSEQGVKGKYSIVPYPACVGWLDRELPGWSRKQLQESIKLVRELMVPNWDIHPEMITHTRVIDIKTGRPFEEISSATMENSYPRVQKSADEMAAYLAYALRILKNCDLPCEGVTTPGGFGNMVKPELSLGVFDAVRDVYKTEIPHYFKYVVDKGTSSQPQLEHVRGLGTDDVKVTVNVVAGTGDWFGGWDGAEAPQPDKYANEAGDAGRIVEMIQAGEPAVFLCHWPGMYCNGGKAGFTAFQRVVTTINREYHDVTRWMKLSEISRYWAAKGLTAIDRDEQSLSIGAPFDCPSFTLRVNQSGERPPKLIDNGKQTELTEVTNLSKLEPGCWFKDDGAAIICFDLSRGRLVVQL